MSIVVQIHEIVMTISNDNMEGHKSSGLPVLHPVTKDQFQHPKDKKCHGKQLNLQTVEEKNVIKSYT